MVRDYIPVVDKNGVACMYDKVTKELYYNDGTGEFKVKPEDIQPIPTSKEISLQIGGESGVNNVLNMEFEFDFGEIQGNVTTKENASELISSSDNFIQKLLSMRSKIGSTMNRLDSISQLQQNDIVNLNTKQSIIMDADMAQEATNLTHTQILQQISTSLFTQAHNITGNLALRLLTI